MSKAYKNNIYPIICAASSYIDDTFPIFVQYHKSGGCSTTRKM